MMRTAITMVTETVKPAFSPWPVGIVLVFVLLFIGGIWLYRTANDGPSEWLAGNAYEEGLKYEQVIAEERAFLEQGVKLNLNAQSGQALELELLRADSKPLAGATVNVFAMRPGDSHLDRKVTMLEISPGKYRAAELILAHGLWVIEVRAADGEVRYRARRREFVS